MLISHLLACRRPVPPQPPAPPGHARGAPGADAPGEGGAASGASIGHPGPRREAHGDRALSASSGPLAALARAGSGSAVAAGSSSRWGGPGDGGAATSTGAQSRPLSSGRAGQPAGGGYATQGLGSGRWGVAAHGEPGASAAAGGSGGRGGVSVGGSGRLSPGIPPRANSAPRLRERQLSAGGTAAVRDRELSSPYLASNGLRPGSGRLRGPASMGARGAASILSGTEAGTSQGGVRRPLVSTHRPPSPSPYAPGSGRRP